MCLNACSFFILCQQYLGRLWWRSKYCNICLVWSTLCGVFKVFDKSRPVCRHQQDCVISHPFGLVSPIRVWVPQGSFYFWEKDPLFRIWKLSLILAHNHTGITAFNSAPFIFIFKQAILCLIWHLLGYLYLQIRDKNSSLQLRETSPRRQSSNCFCHIFFSQKSAWCPLNFTVHSFCPKILITSLSV